MTEPNMEWDEKCSNKDGLCIPEDGLHFVECELYRMKKPESSLRKKWDEGIRPCSFDEVENFMSMAISEAEQRGYEKGKAECCVSKLGCLCNPVGNCNLDTCPCPEHYGTHEEWLASLIH